MTMAHHLLSGFPPLVVPCKGPFDQPTWPWVKTPSPPVNIPIPTKIGSKMGGKFTYPKMGSQNGCEPQPYMSCTKLALKVIPCFTDLWINPLLGEAKTKLRKPPVRLQTLRPGDPDSSSAACSSSCRPPDSRLATRLTARKNARRV